MKNKHLTVADRQIITVGITKLASHKSIAESIGKDPSTIAKEIRLHRKLTSECAFTSQCVNIESCDFNHMCSEKCTKYVRFKCKIRDRTPGACNGCDKFDKCIYDKYIYNPDDAQQTYKDVLENSRKNIRYSSEEISKIGAIICPLIKQGLSPYQILMAHPEINISRQTLYNYIDNNVFRDFDICNIDLRCKVKWKTVKKHNRSKENQSKKYINGHKYIDYKNYIKTHPYSHILEMDTVSNTVKNGPCLQTFLFKKTYFLFAIYHSTKNSSNMVDGINMLTNILGVKLFKKYASIILTDRGTEFSETNNIEFYHNKKRTKIFYCDPMKPGQKGDLEQKHKFLRYILPKNKKFSKVGLKGQDELNIILSNINSLPLAILNGKSAFQYIKFMYPDLYIKLLEFGLKEIEFDNINMTKNIF